MGVFRKSKDEKGKPAGPWFIQYPHSRGADGKIKYKTEKASWQKKKAQDMLRKKQDEFLERDKMGIRVNPDLTFSELMDWGLSQEVMKVKASASDDKGRAKHLKAYFGEIEARQVTPLAVENFRVKMKHTVSEKTQKPFSGTTVNKLVTLGRRVYYLAMDEGLVSNNPFARRGVYKEHPKGKYIPDEEFRTILEHLPEYLKPVLLTAYLTGMRRGEIIGLKWSQVDLELGTLDLSAEDTKTDEPRIIYLASIPELRRIFVEAKLKRRPRQVQVFCKDDGQPVPKWYIERLLKKACLQAKVGPYRLHDCRHTFNTNMVKAGVDRSVIMKMTGHKTLAMFLRYSHLDREQSESAMESLNELLSAKKEKAHG